MANFVVRQGEAVSFNRRQDLLMFHKNLGHLVECTWFPWRMRNEGALAFFWKEWGKKEMGVLHQSSKCLRPPQKIKRCS